MLEGRNSVLEVMVVPQEGAIPPPPQGNGGGNEEEEGSLELFGRWIR